MVLTVMRLAIPLIVLLATLVTRGRSLDWENCGSKLVVKALRITGCLKQPCIFTAGEDYKLEVDAMAVGLTATLPYSVRASSLFEYDVSDGDACQHLIRGSACPILKEGQAINFSKNFQVQFPGVPTLRAFPATVIAEMVDDHGVKLLCARMEVEVRRRDGESSFPFGLLDLWI